MDNGLARINDAYATTKERRVLILVVVDNGLVQYINLITVESFPVLILVVVDNGLVQRIIG